MYCRNCGKEIADPTIKFCPNCGESVSGVEPEEPVAVGSIRCPKCGSTDVEMQVHQEQRGGATVTKTKSKYKQKGHGCLWWLFIGWWWWMVDLIMWIFIFPVRFLVQLFKKKKYVGDSTSVTSTKNKIKYKTVCLCRSCGYNWEK